MPRPLILAITLAATASLLAGTLFACCVGSSFEEQVGRAELIFAGTVTSAEPVRLPNTVVTRYKFDDVRYVKGDGPSDSLVLAQEGGCIGGFCISSSLGVSFTVGTRYVVFADSSYGSLPREYTSMVCGTGHPFSIRADSASASPIVHVGEGPPVIAFDGRHLVLLAPEPWRPEMGVWLIGADGRYVASDPPPRLALDELIRSSDLEWEARIRGYAKDPEQAEQESQLIHYVMVYPHQDPGVRVSEDEFLRALGEVVARVCGP